MEEQKEQTKPKPNQFDDDSDEEIDYLKFMQTKKEPKIGVGLSH